MFYLLNLKTEFQVKIKYLRWFRVEPEFDCSN